MSTYSYSYERKGRRLTIFFDPLLALPVIKTAVCASFLISLLKNTKNSLAINSYRYVYGASAFSDPGGGYSIDSQLIKNEAAGLLGCGDTAANKVSILVFHYSYLELCSPFFFWNLSRSTPCRTSVMGTLFVSVTEMDVESTYLCFKH